MEMGRKGLSNALSAMVNAEKRAKATVQLQPISAIVSSFPRIMKDRESQEITVKLQGRIKDCRALMYRQDLKTKDIEQYQLHMLPTHQWGYVVMTTPEGVLDHEEAMKRNAGGEVLGYFHYIFEVSDDYKMTCPEIGRGNRAELLNDRQRLSCFR